jgi:hypothetical protein
MVAAKGCSRWNSLLVQLSCCESWLVVTARSRCPRGIDRGKAGRQHSKSCGQCPEQNDIALASATLNLIKRLTNLTTGKQQCHPWVHAVDWTLTSLGDDIMR